MKVLKFGGTSVGKPERMQAVASIVGDSGKCIVVLSALSGTTDELLVLSDLLYHQNKKEASSLIERLKKSYLHFIEELFAVEVTKKKAVTLIDEHFNYLHAFTMDEFSLFEERSVLAQGELMSTALFQLLMEEKQLSSSLIPALNFMRVDEDLEPDKVYIQKYLFKELASLEKSKILITQGYICLNQFGEIDNLKRGGSDYTASLIGAAIDAEEIQIWTDIDGMHNNDPRYVENTSPIAALSFEEAAELAYFGAKILHPASISPAREKGIPVMLLNTMNRIAHGTKITSDRNRGNIKAIAAKDKITIIKIKSGRMLLAYGFLRKIFEIFERYKTSIDMIATSEVAVSLTIDSDDHLKEITKELAQFALVETELNQSIVCVVGDFLADKKGYAAKLFDKLAEIPIRMISYGGSKNNISLVVDTANRTQALNALHELFDKSE